VTTPEDGTLQERGQASGFWTPRPDPTALTTEAVEKATAQYRRELAGLREILETRLRGMDEDRGHLWDAVNSWPAGLETRLERRRREFLEDLAGVRELVEQRLDALDKSIKLAADGLASIPDNTEAERRKLEGQTSRQFAAEREYVLGQIEIARAETRRVGDVGEEKFAAVDALFASNALALAAALAAQEKAVAAQNDSNTLAIDRANSATKETIAANAAQTATSLTSQAATIADLKDRVVRIESTGAGISASRADQRLNMGTVIAAVAVLVAIVSFILYAVKK
jgi:hypothetical protein